MRLRTFFLPILCCGIIASAQTAPVIDAQALDGTRVHLPAKQQPSVLVLGFSRKASTDVMEWGKRLTAATWNSKQAAVYEAAMLASLPKPLRGLVVRSMRSQVPEPARGHFLLLYNDEKLWRNLAGVTSEDDVYLLLLAGDGTLRWRGQGAYSAALFAQVTQHVEALQTK